MSEYSEIILGFDEEDFYSGSYTDANTCAITKALEKAGYEYLFHSGDYIQYRKTLKICDVGNLEELNDMVKGMYKRAGGFSGKVKSVYPDDFKYELKIKL